MLKTMLKKLEGLYIRKEIPDLPQTHQRMLQVYKEKTRGSNYTEKASYCPTKVFFLFADK
jgi:hypothetical protein